MNAPRKGRGRWQLLLIALVFFGPLLIATWMYRTGAFAPAERSNAGTLLEPVENLADALPGFTVRKLAEGQWIMLYINVGNCGEPCREALYKMRQTRQMVGRERDRLARVFLHGETLPDRVFLDETHPGLKTTNDKSLGELLNDKRPDEVEPGGIYLIDPLDNLVMYFPPGLDPRAMVDDIKHLLKISRIG